MVEKWRPHFQRMRHAHAVNLIEDIVRKIVALVKKHIAVQSAAVSHGGKNVVHGTGSRVGKEFALFRFGKSAIPVDVRVFRSKQRTLQKAFYFVFETDLVV